MAKKTKENQSFEHLTKEKVRLDPIKITEIMTEESRNPVPMKRLVSKKILTIKPSRWCSDILAKNWHKLREMVMIKETPCRTFRGYNCEDVLHETFEYLIRDNRVKEATEQEIIDSFIYRFDNLMCVTKMDNILERQILSGGEIDSVTFDGNSK